MEAGALVATPRAAATAAKPEAGPRIGVLFAGTGLALFAVMGLLGLAMRLSQGEVIELSPTWFYRIMTLHGAGMLVGALLAEMGAMWYAVRRVVALDLRLALLSYGAIVAGASCVLVATLVGGFAPGWTFLWPLPFIPQGAWATWTTALFLVGLVVVGAGFMAFCIDLLARVTARYGSLGRTLGVRFLRGRDDDPPPPQVIAATVISLAGLVSSAAGVTILTALIGRLIDSGVAIDALWAKNVTYFFGHSYANLIIYLGVGVAYVLVPHFTRRPWKTTAPIVVGWLATLVLVLTAYFHHLYLDFVQPLGLSVIGTIASSSAAVPVLVVTIYTAMMLVWGSRYRWTLASTLLFLGFAGWAIGGAGAVLDSLIPANFRLHNTLWVPAHFHTYLLLGAIFWAMALLAHVLERRAGRTAPAALRRPAIALMVVGGAGLVGTWYVSGALGIPRRYAVQPFDTAGYSLAGAVFAIVFAAGFVVFLAALGSLLRAPKASAPSEAEEPDAAASEDMTRALGGKPVTRRELFLLGIVMTVAPVALLPPLVEAAESSVRWHHLTHAAMFLAGAAAMLALCGVDDVWRSVRRIPPAVGLALAVLAPVVSLLAMTPRFYADLEGRETLHFGYHLVFFVGLGALTALGASRLGRAACWAVVILAVCTGVLYSAGVYAT